MNRWSSKICSNGEMAIDTSLSCQKREVEVTTQTPSDRVTDSDAQYEEYNHI